MYQMLVLPKHLLYCLHTRASNFNGLMHEMGCWRAGLFFVGFLRSTAAWAAQQQYCLHDLVMVHRRHSCGCCVGYDCARRFIVPRAHGMMLVAGCPSNTTRYVDIQ